MKIAVVIMIVAMVARAQGLRCAVCVHQTGEEIIKMAEVTEGQFTEQDCKPTSVVEYNPDYGEVCLSIFMTFTTILLLLRRGLWSLLLGNRSKPL